MEKIYLAIVLISLIVSMLMSSFEMVYVRKAPMFNIFERQLHDRTGVLTTVLFWNTFALTFGLVNLYKFIESINIPAGLLISGVGGALLFAIFGDMVPKIMSVVWTDALFRILVYPFMAFYYILKFTGFISVVSRILTSKYSNYEIVDFIIRNMKSEADKKDVEFIKRTINYLYMPARGFTVQGNCDKVKHAIKENATCMQAIIKMRELGISRIRIGNAGVFDLHEFIKKVSSQP